MHIMRAGRARWCAEDETTNTLKSHGYAFGHDFGHGNCNLADVLAHLMMLGFLRDQVELRCCARFDAARENAGRMKYLRQRIRSYFVAFRIPDWATLYLSIAFPTAKPELEYNDTS